MRITHRYSSNKEYWEKRWADTPIDAPMENEEKYPLKYAEIILKDDKSGRILEAGCGAGRILRHYHQSGRDIVGIDFVPGVISDLKATDPTLQVETGDVTNLKFSDNSFEYILAFGLYHNLTIDKIRKAIEETFRILKHKGKVCASFRADNIQNRLNDFIANRRQIKNKLGPNNTTKQFHKMNLKRNEFSLLFEEAGFEIETVLPVENMPLLYKFPFFRHKMHKRLNEKLGRSQGYLLSRLGNIIQNILVGLFPNQFCNVYVLIAQKR